MKRSICLLAISIICFTASAQEKTLPAEAKQFVLKGYEMLDYVTGDINGDKKPDGILVLKELGEDTTTEEAPRPMLLLIRQANGKLKQEKRNDHIIFCRECGGMFGDPYESTTISGGHIVFEFYGGSSWRWGYRYDFKYVPQKKDWILDSQTETSYQTGDPESTEKVIDIPGNELGEISIGVFPIDNMATDTKWKVISDKTYFYESPKPGSKPRKGYLLKGNTASGLRELKNFVELSFENGKGQFTNGFILKKDLQKL